MNTTRRPRLSHLLSPARWAELARRLAILAPTIIEVGCVALVALGVVGVGALAARNITIASLELDVGDVLVVPADPLGQALPGMPVTATIVAGADLPAGARCVLGFGKDAAAGGTLVITRRDPAGDYLASWAGAGRSTKQGQDCGRSAELRLTGDEIRDMRLAVLLAPLVSVTAPLN